MKKNLLLIVLISLNSYSQYKGIANFGFSESNSKEFFINGNEILTKQITFSNFLFDKDLIKLDIDRDFIFLANHSSQYKTNDFKYFFFQKDIIENKYSQTDYYLKKTDTLFLNYKKVDFIDYKLDKNLINEENYIGIDEKNVVFIHKLDKCYIVINELNNNQYEIKYYFNKVQIDSLIVSHQFLNKFYTINEKLFLKFDDYVVLFYLY